MFPKDK